MTRIEKAKKEFATHGFTKLEDVFLGRRLAKVEAAVNAVCRAPSPFFKRIKSKSGPGEFLMDFNNWRRLTEVKSLCFDKELVTLVKAIADSSKCWIFHDHLLVKKGYAPSTPWHQDRPYYIFKGDRNLSVWIPTCDIATDLSLKFLVGSHKSNKLFVPRSFVDGAELGQRSDLDILTDEVIGRYPIESVPLNAGDVILFSNQVLHSAPAHNHPSDRTALSIRYLLDGALLTEQYINATPPFNKMGVKVAENGTIPENFFPRADQGL
ncbi:phytanoyl-CoA dioxygenase family protein [Arenicellales bacterium IMCC56312]